MPGYFYKGVFSGKATIPSSVHNRHATVEYISEGQWLDSRGERDHEDICYDSLGKYVLMGDGQGSEEKIYLPEQFQ